MQTKSPSILEICTIQVKGEGGHKPLKEASWWTKDDVEKVTELNNFFCSVFVNDNSCNEEVRNFTQHNDGLPDVEITTEKVWNKLRKMNGAKSCGPDNIRPCLLKACCEELAEPLSLILQKSCD